MWISRTQASGSALAVAVRFFLRDIVTLARTSASNLPPFRVRELPSGGSITFLRNGLDSCVDFKRRLEFLVIKLIKLTG